MSEETGCDGATVLVKSAFTADAAIVELAQVYQATEIILTLLTSHAGQSIIEG